MTPENIVKKITEEFFIRKAASTSQFETNYYWKWIGNWQLAKLTGWDVHKLREMCRQMEKEGILHSIKRSNMVLWACKIEGYKQHQYQDYYELC